MDINTVAAKLGYPSIFCASPEDAAANLSRLIIDRQCGFDEGAHHWQKAVSEILDGNHDLLKMNACGAKLTEIQWRDALRLLHADLTTHIDHAHNS